MLPFLSFVAFWGHYSQSQAARSLIDPLAKVVPTSTPTVTPIIIEVIEGDPIIGEINRTFKNESRVTIAKVIHCFFGESKLNPLAYNFNKNGTADVGVAQINDVHGMSVEDRQDYRKNIKKAYEIFKRRGFSAWYHKNCR